MLARLSPKCAGGDSQRACMACSPCMLCMWLHYRAPRENLVASLARPITCGRDEVQWDEMRSMVG